MRGSMDLTERLRRLHRPGVRIDRAYRRWLARAPVPGAGVAPDILISVLMPVFDTPAPFLRAAIASVLAQTTPCWELCIADDASRDANTLAVLAEAAGDPRIRRVRLERQSGIAAATNAALAMARGVFVALLDHDDMLAPHAVARVAAEIAFHPDADMIFSDEDRLEDGHRVGPYFKPGWNFDLMLGQNCVSHLGVYRRTLALSLGGFRKNFDGSQDYDFAWRVAEACGPARIRHIPEVLYHWRQSGGSFSASHAAEAGDALRRAASCVLPPGTQVRPDALLPQWNRVMHPMPDARPSVTYLVRGEGAAPNDPAYPATQTLHTRDWRQACGDVVVFLAPGLVAAEAGWMRELVTQLGRQGVGAAGARLDRADGRILHAGWVLDFWRVAGTLHPRSDASDPGYFGHFLLPRTVAAVSGDCLAVRRDRLFELGGLDPACGRYADVDFCLRLASRGLRSVWTPHARLRVTAPVRPRPDRRAARMMRARWGDLLARDPYLNPNLRVRGGTLSLRHRPPGSFSS